MHTGAYNEAGVPNVVVNAEKKDARMRMPNSERAIVAEEKLRDYCLSPDHPRGRHKARVFAKALGMTNENVTEMREALLLAAQTTAAVVSDRDDYGQRYVIDFLMSGPAGQATVRSSWIVKSDEDFPRLTSCYVL